MKYKSPNLIWEARGSDSLQGLL